MVAAHVDAVELARDLAGLRLGQRQRVVEARTAHRDQLAVAGPDAGQGAQLVFGRRLAELLQLEEGEELEMTDRATLAVMAQNSPIMR